MPNINITILNDEENRQLSGTAGKIFAFYNLIPKITIAEKSFLSQENFPGKLAKYIIQEFMGFAVFVLHMIIRINTSSPHARDLCFPEFVLSGINDGEE